MNGAKLNRSLVSLSSLAPGDLPPQRSGASRKCVPKLELGNEVTPCDGQSPSWGRVGGVAAVGEQGGDEAVDVEEVQVLDFLAQPDVLDGDVELLPDGNHHAAFRGAVELGQNDPRATGRLRKTFGLADPVLAGGGIQDEEHFVRCVGDELGDHAADLGELIHQVGLRL